MQFRHAFLNSSLVLQLIILRDELRITSAAEPSFSRSFSKRQHKQTQMVPTHIRCRDQNCFKRLTFFLRFESFSAFFISVCKDGITLCLLWLKISSRWCSRSTSVAETGTRNKKKTYEKRQKKQPTHTLLLRVHQSLT